MPEELSISTGLAKERLSPMLQAAGLPDLQVQLVAATATALTLAVAACRTILQHNFSETFDHHHVSSLLGLNLSWRLFRS